MSAFIGGVLSKQLDIGYVDLDVEKGVKNGLVNNSYSFGIPAIEFTKNDTGVGRVKYAISTPERWDENTDIIFKIFWSPADINKFGNVSWQICYKSISYGCQLNTGVCKVCLNQNSVNLDSIMYDTGDKIKLNHIYLCCPGTIFVDIERNIFQDTYDDSVKMHLARLEYKIK